MDCILLAAGYATRLYPLTEHTPKALLKLGSKTILDRVMDKLEEIEQLNNVYVVTNHRFAALFTDWAKAYGGKKPVKVLDDGTTDNDNRLGAIGDMQYVIDREHLEDELFILASDNIFHFSLLGMVDMYYEKGCDLISAHYIAEKATLQKMGVVELDARNKVLGFEEKPQEPKSHYGVPPFYFYRKSTVPLIKKYLEEGNNPDAPGHFIPWLITQTDVYAYTFDDLIIDIGTPESYYEAQELFQD